MSIGVIGAGHIGGNLAYVLASAGEHVLIAGSGSPEVTAAKIGKFDNVVAVEARDAAEADIVALALPWAERSKLAAVADKMTGKIVLDITNPYKSDLSGIEDLGGERSSAIIARLLPGARIVKVLNTLYYKFLQEGRRPRGATDRIALPVSGDDAAAKVTVMSLLDKAGFDSVDIGSIVGSDRQEPGGFLYNTAMTEAELKAALKR